MGAVFAAVILDGSENGTPGPTETEIRQRHRKPAGRINRYLWAVCLKNSRTSTSVARSWP